MRSTFETLIAKEELGHAYLFDGDREIGKALFAEHLAARIERGIFEVSAEPLLDRMRVSPNERGNLGIDEVRALKHFLWQTPVRSSRRVAIIDGAEALTPEAQGALLKIVEEPPAHGLLVLVTYDSQALTAPLLSRLTKIYFPRMSSCALAAFLVKEKKCSSAEAARIASRAYGRVGRALALLADEPPVADEVGAQLEARIVALRERDLVKNSATLRWLLERALLVAQFNVNAPLQKKAVEYKGSRPYNEHTYGKSG